MIKIIFCNCFHPPIWPISLNVHFRLFNDPTTSTKFQSNFFWKKFFCFANFVMSPK